jgi:hypothetical protein
VNADSHDHAASGAEAMEPRPAELGALQALNRAGVFTRFADSGTTRARRLDQRSRTASSTEERAQSDIWRSPRHGIRSCSQREVRIPWPDGVKSRFRTAAPGATPARPV